MFGYIWAFFGDLKYFYCVFIVASVPFDTAGNGKETLNIQIEHKITQLNSTQFYL